MSRLATRRLRISLMERARRTHGLSLLPSWLKSQWSGHEQLAARRLGDLREYLIWCGNEIPWYRQLFAERSFDPAAMTTTADLSVLPVMDKDTIRRHAEAIKPADFQTRVTRSKVTSGSTGVPLTFHLDSRAHSVLWAQIWRAWDQFGFSPGDKFATLAGGALIPDKITLKQKLYMLLSGSVFMPCYHMSEAIMEEYASTLSSGRIKLLYGYPSSIALLAEYIQAGPPRSFPMVAVVTTSELLSDKARALLEQTFGCAVHDSYGCNDAGLYGFECDRHDGYHLGMESVLAEIVDDEGRSLPDGEVGRIVTTHFVNHSFPLLRYATGDLGAINREPCGCGRGLERIVKLQGRESDYVMTPDGRKILHPFFLFFEPFHDTDWLQRWQVHQSSIDAITLRLQVSRDPGRETLAHIVSEMKRGLGEMDIHIELVDQVRLSPKGKFMMIDSDLY